MNLTHHAQARMQQRGIDPYIVELTMDYGATKYCGGGIVKYYFNRKSRRELGRALGARVVERLGPLLNAVVVESQEKGRPVITVSRRDRRIRG
jgi:hypothetical protein